jgi:glycosyltransferase involved in cell wall biosynthesis
VVATVHPALFEVEAVCHKAVARPGDSDGLRVDRGGAGSTVCHDPAMVDHRREAEAGREGSAARRRAGVYYPGLDGRGGAQRLALVLALVLARQGYATTVFTDGAVDVGRVASDLGADLSPVSFATLRGGGAGWSGLRELQRLAMTRSHASQIRRHDLDLFVNAKYKSSLPGCGRRNVYYCHFPHHLGVVGAGRVRRLYLWVTSVAERVSVVRDRRGFVATYDEIWANSRFTSGHVQRRWGRSATVVHPPCERIAGTDKQRVIAVVGRFQRPRPNVPYKAQDVLLRTFAAMTDLHAAGWRLVMAGATTPDDAQYLAELSQEAEGLPVTILRDVSRDDIRALLGEASLYWHAQGFAQDARHHPETQEHFGISTVEAMSAGAIPVVFGSAGPAEVVEGVEGIVSWTCPSQLAELTRAWVARSPRELEEVRQRCRDRAEQFDEASFRRRVEALT